MSHIIQSGSEFTKLILVIALDSGIKLALGHLSRYRAYIINGLNYRIGKTDAKQRNQSEYRRSYAHGNKREIHQLRVYRFQRGYISDDVAGFPPDLQRGRYRHNRFTRRRLSADPSTDITGNGLRHIAGLNRFIRLETAAACLHFAFIVQDKQLRIVQLEGSQHFCEIIRVPFRIESNKFLKIIRCPCRMNIHVIFNRVVVIHPNRQGKNDLYHKECYKYYDKIM
ncbi:hypothetical protein D3C76_416540 [compost metagenome]